MLEKSDFRRKGVLHMIANWNNGSHEPKLRCWATLMTDNYKPLQMSDVRYNKVQCIIYFDPWHSWRWNLKGVGIGCFRTFHKAAQVGRDRYRLRRKFWEGALFPRRVRSIIIWPNRRSWDKMRNKEQVRAHCLRDGLCWIMSLRNFVGKRGRAVPSIYELWSGGLYGER